MSARRANPSRGVVVTSRKKAKLGRKLAYEVGVQRARAIKEAQARVEAAMEVAPSVWVVADQAYQEGRAWRCNIYLMSGENRKGTWFCMHNHKSPETARACAAREAKGRNKHEDWTDEKVLDLVREVTAKG